MQPEMDSGGAVPAEVMNVLPTDQRQFGRYHLLYRFATGGMANLYLAHLVGSQGFEKLVALKRIHEHLTENQEFLQMFVDEARLCARLSHPNVVQVIELGQVGPSHYIAMEYVEGETLSAIMRRIRPPLPVAARIVASAASGLHAAHNLRDADGELLHVVHRDVSPQNILISYDGAVKVVDFGVARARSNLHTTSAGQVKGKFAYMAPEQVALDEVDHRVDVFALGIVLWECTTGHRLFKAPNDAATVAKVREMEIIPPGILVEGYPRALEAVVMKALQRDPDLRFQTAEEMEDAIEDYLIEVGSVVQPRQIAELMRETFVDRIEAKRKMMVQAEEGRELLSSPGSVVGSQVSGSMSGPTMTEGQARIQDLERRSRRRHAIAAAATMTVGVASLVAGLLVLSSHSTPPAAARQPDAMVVSPPPVEPKAPTEPKKPAAKPKPVKIKVLVKASPEEATITVDGEKVDNPFTLEREPTDGEIAVRITAPDHVAQEFRVPLQESGRWVISLQPEPKTKKRPIRRRIHRRKPKIDDDLFGDPYGR